ncbi:MAG: hypothetical protein ACI4QT_09890 [Kiritimatiellia bacterium]
MRTTLDIPDAMYRRIKMRTAQEGITVRSITLALYAQWLGEQPDSESRHSPARKSKVPSWFGSVKVDADMPHDMASIRESIARYQDGIAAGDVFSVSDLVASESYYAIQHHYGKTKEEALDALKNFSRGEGISFSQNFLTAVDTPNIHKASPGFVDRLLASDYGGRGQITLSCEKSFRRLHDTEVIS